MDTNLKISTLEEVESMVIQSNGLVMNFVGSVFSVPKSSEIHHTKKPKCKYLNDESTWMAVSREGHEWIEHHKSEARELGMLQNI